MVGRGFVEMRRSPQPGWVRVGEGLKALDDGLTQCLAIDVIASLPCLT